MDQANVIVETGGNEAWEESPAKHAKSIGGSELDTFKLANGQYTNLVDVLLHVYIISELNSSG